jgi:curli biogenesis system outer membrane secretion channel CsgG
MSTARYTFFLFAVLAIAPVHTAAADDTDKPKPILSRDISSVPGPKRTIAVGNIDAMGPQSSGNTGWSVGGSISAMLTTALQESNRFIVLERAGLSQVLNEQQMAAHHVSGGTDAPQPGNIIPAQYLVEGSVTEFGTTDSGSGLNIGGGSGSFLGGLGVNETKGSVAIDLRIVDTRTGGIVQTFTVRHELTSTGVGVTGGVNGLSIGGNQFWSTPIGEATREVLNDAVEKIAETLASGDWQGAVVEVDGATVYVNAGSASGLRSGDQLLVERATKVFTDPRTGEVLSQKQSVLGTITVSEIEEKLSSGSFAPSDPSAPARGDLVVFKKPSP